MVLQSKPILREIEAVEAIRHVFPVDEVLAVKDYKTRHSMHGGAGEVVIIAYAKDVWV